MLVWSALPLVARIRGVGLFAEVLPAGLLHVDAIVFGGGFDVGKGLLALGVGDASGLVEAGDGVADVAGVGEGFLAFPGEGVDGLGELVAIGGVEFAVLFVGLPGGFHGRF